MGERFNQLKDLHRPQVGSVDGQAPVDRFLLDVALIQLTVRDAAVFTRIKLTKEEAWMSLQSATAEAQQLPALRLDVGRSELVARTVAPLGLEEPGSWEPMSYIPYGSDLPWIEHWAALLSDIAMYASTLREAPYRLRYELIELREGDGGRQGVIQVVDDGTSERATTVVPIPVPALERDEVVGIGYRIREWLFLGEGEVLADGTRVKVFR